MGQGPKGQDTVETLRQKDRWQDGQTPVRYPVFVLLYGAARVLWPLHFVFLWVLFLRELWEKRRDMYGNH